MNDGYLWVRETFVNETRGYRFGETPAYETYTDDLGRLFRDMQREYGRCVSSMYVDKRDGRTVQTGWVFSKRMQYEDCDETYTREVWVEVFAAEPERFERTVSPWEVSA